MKVCNRVQAFRGQILASGIVENPVPGGLGTTMADYGFLIYFAVQFKNAGNIAVDPAVFQV